MDTDNKTKIVEIKTEGFWALFVVMCIAVGAFQLGWWTVDLIVDHVYPYIKQFF